MKKILPFQKSIIDVYNGYACTTGIFLHSQSGREWFIQNYLNIKTTFNENYDYIYMDYFYSDLFYCTAVNYYQPETIVKYPYDCYSLPRSEVKTIVQFIKEKIYSGFYVCLFLNLKYLKKYFREEDFIHDIFIYGYDDEKEIFYSIGYIQNEKLAYLEHSYTEISLAYKNFNVSSHVHKEFDTTRISFFKCKKDFEYSFDLHRFIKSLKEYLNLKKGYMELERLVYLNTTSNKITVYGIESIVTFANYLKLTSQKEYIDIRQMYFIYNHKKNIYYKIKFLLEKGYLKNDTSENMYNEIVRISKICLTLLIKYQVIKSEKLLDEIVRKLHVLYTKEFNILNDLLAFLTTIVD